LLDREKVITPILKLAMTDKEFMVNYFDQLANIVAELQFEYNKAKLKEARSEQSIEKVLTEGAKKLGALCFKVSSENHVGLPDRLIVYKGASLFVELKKLNGSLSEAQLVRHKQFRANGVEVITLYGIEEVTQYLLCLKEEKNIKSFIYQNGSTPRITRKNAE
jgi:hypothetical protein